MSSTERDPASTARQSVENAGAVGLFARTQISVAALGLLGALTGVLVLAAGLSVHPANAGGKARHWVAAWAASPSDASTVTPTLSNETVRMMIQPTYGGARLRVRLSNRFGSSPVSLARVTIAKQASGAAVVAETLRPVTFDGDGEVQLQQGSDVVSDPVNLRFAAFDDLAVSVYVPDPVQQPTEHFITRQTNNFRSGPGTGDQTSDTEGTLLRIPTKTAFSNGWFFLSELDVLAPEQAGAVVAFGDSITDGYQGFQIDLVENQADMNQNARWPDFLAQRLAAAGRCDLSVVNAGISGNAVLAARCPLPFGESALDRLDADALTVPGATDLILLEGINDLGSNGATAKQVIKGLGRLVQRARAAGLRVHLATLTPSGGALDGSYGTEATNAKREKINAWIRTQDDADSVIDFDAAIRDPREPSRMKAEYDSSDHLHPSSSGYRAMAEAIDLSAIGSSLPGRAVAC